MKTIVRNSSGVSLYLLEDAVPLSVEASRIVVGSPVDLTIGDLNGFNATVFAVPDAPEDWAAEKYLFHNGEWLVNPDYREPRP